MMRSGQKLKKKELNQAMTGNNMEWNSNFQYGDFIGKADVGEFHLGEDFLQNMMVRYDLTWMRRCLKRLDMRL